MPARKTITLPNCFNDPYAFEEVINQQDGIINNAVGSLDLSQLGFIEPYSMLGLLLMGKNYLRNTGKKLTLTNMPLNIHQYLYRMDFFKQTLFDIRDDLDEKFFLKRSALSKSVIEITDIPVKERESVKAISTLLSVFRKRASHILKFWLNDTIVDYFVTVISEICQNVYEHSMDSGFLSMQTYSHGNRQIVRLVISDSGLGIRDSFSSRPDIQFESPAHLIEMTLTTNISSKRDFGYGLSQVNNIVEKLNGNIFIRSQDASVTVLNNKNQSGQSRYFLKNGLAPFPGTQLSISLIK